MEGQSYSSLHYHHSQPSVNPNINATSSSSAVPPLTMFHPNSPPFHYVSQQQHNNLKQHPLQLLSSHSQQQISPAQLLFHSLHHHPLHHQTMQHQPLQPMQTLPMQTLPMQTLPMQTLAMKHQPMQNPVQHQSIQKNSLSLLNLAKQKQQQLQSKNETKNLRSHNNNFFLGSPQQLHPTPPPITPQEKQKQQRNQPLEKTKTTSNLLKARQNPQQRKATLPHIPQNLSHQTYATQQAKIPLKNPTQSVQQKTALPVLVSPAKHEELVTKQGATPKQATQTVDSPAPSFPPVFSKSLEIRPITPPDEIPNNVINNTKPDVDTNEAKPDGDTSKAKLDVPTNDPCTRAAVTTRAILAKSWEEKTIHVARNIMGGSTVNGFLRATAAMQRIKRQRARQVSVKKEGGCGVLLDIEEKKKWLDALVKEGDETFKLESMTGKTVKRMRSEMLGGILFCSSVSGMVESIIKEINEYQEIKNKDDRVLAEKAMLAKIEMMKRVNVKQALKQSYSKDFKMQRRNSLPSSSVNNFGGLRRQISAEEGIREIDKVGGAAVRMRKRRNSSLETVGMPDGSKQLNKTMNAAKRNCIINEVNMVPHTLWKEFSPSTKSSEFTSSGAADIPSKNNGKLSKETCSIRNMEAENSHELKEHTTGTQSALFSGNKNASFKSELEHQHSTEAPSNKTSTERVTEMSAMASNVTLGNHDHVAPNVSIAQKKRTSVNNFSFHSNESRGTKSITTVKTYAELLNMKNGGARNEEYITSKEVTKKPAKHRPLKKGDLVAVKLGKQNVFVLSQVVKTPSFSRISNNSTSVDKRNLVHVRNVEYSNLNDQGELLGKVDGKIKSVSQNLVLPLPRSREETSQWYSEIQKGTRIYATYPNTTVLYLATVVANGTISFPHQDKSDAVLVEFDDDEDEKKALPQRLVRAKFLAIMPTIPSPCKKRKNKYYKKVVQSKSTEPLLSPLLPTNSSLKSANANQPKGSSLPNSILPTAIDQISSDEPDDLLALDLGFDFTCTDDFNLGKRNGINIALAQVSAREELVSSTTNDEKEKRKKCVQVGVCNTRARMKKK